MCACTATMHVNAPSIMHAFPCAPNYWVVWMASGGSQLGPHTHNAHARIVYRNSIKTQKQHASAWHIICVCVSNVHPPDDDWTHIIYALCPDLNFCFRFKCAIECTFIVLALRILCVIERKKERKNGKCSITLAVDRDGQRGWLQFHMHICDRYSIH